MQYLLPLPLVVSATVHLALTPLRRIRLLMAVQRDLEEEGVFPPTHTKQRGSGPAPGSVVGCARFLYQVGGVGAFYRGALLEYGGVVAKFLLQVAVVVPLCRLIPLQMHRSYMLTTLIHTVVLFLPIAPIQALIDTVIVNACTDFECRADDSRGTHPRRPVASASGSPVRGAGGHSTHHRHDNKDIGDGGEEVLDGGSFQFRFDGLWEAAQAARATLPVSRLVRTLMSLDFAGRYVSSLVFNKAIGLLYDRLTPAYDEAGEGALMSVFVWVVPPLVSMGYGLVTYPAVSLVFAHFTRVRLYEREAAAAAARKAALEMEYRHGANVEDGDDDDDDRHIHHNDGTGSDHGADGGDRSNNHSVANYSHADSAASAASFGYAVTTPGGGVAFRSRHMQLTHNLSIAASYEGGEGSGAPPHPPEAPLVDRVADMMCHWDVRDYLFFTYEQDGVAGLYRGYSMHAAMIALGAAMGTVLTGVVMEAGRILRGGARHAAALNQHH